MNPHRLTLGLLGLFTVLAGAGFFLQWRTNQALWQAIENLSGAMPPGGARSLAAGGSGSAAPVGIPVVPGVELVRLREEVNELRARTAALARLSVRAAGDSGGGAPPLALQPAGAWKNAGHNTPAAAAETVFWATDSGDVTALANSITLDEAARAKAQEILARMSDSVRATYDTPEKLVALLLARETDIRAMQVLGESAAGDDAVVSLRLLKDDGKTKDEGYQFRRTSDGWRMNVTGKVVDKMGKKLSEPAKKDGKK